MWHYCCIPAVQSSRNNTSQLKISVVELRMALTHFNSFLPPLPPPQFTPSTPLSSPLSIHSFHPSLLPSPQFTPSTPLLPPPSIHSFHPSPLPLLLLPSSILPPPPTRSSPTLTLLPNHTPFSHSLSTSTPPIPPPPPLPPSHPK